jgi:hypothetical protein
MKRMVDGVIFYSNLGALSYIHKNRWKNRRSWFWHLIVKKCDFYYDCKIMRFDNLITNIKRVIKLKVSNNKIKRL